MCEVVLQDIAFYYGKLPAVQGIAFTVNRGDFVVMVGPNGAGKSTVLKLMAGIFEPTAGKVIIDDQTVAVARRSGKIAYVPQNYSKNAADFPATVEEIIRLGFVAKPAAGKKNEAKLITDLLQQQGLEPYRHRRLCELSGGQQQRVVLARALAAEPQLLLLDEPTSGVDFDTSEHIYKMLRQINQTQQVTIIMVSHDIERTTQYANKVACIRGGLCFWGSNTEFRGQHAAGNHFW